MKRKLAALKTSLLAAVLAVMLAACSVQSTQAAVPDLGQVRSICSLATLECYYHNVAKSTKTAGGGITGIFERDRTFWIEYDGIATLGIDMSLVEMDLDGQNVHISLPPAQVMHISMMRIPSTRNLSSIPRTAGTKTPSQRPSRRPPSSRRSCKWKKPCKATPRCWPAPRTAPNL